MADGVSLESILNRNKPDDTQQYVEPPPPRRQVRFADPVVEEHNNPTVFGGLIQKNNYYMIMIESLRTAFLAGILTALFQVDFIRSFVVSNVSGVMSPNLSIYGFFVFVAIGAVAFKLMDITSKPE